MDWADWSVRETRRGGPVTWTSSARVLRFSVAEGVRIADALPLRWARREQPDD
jgi:hypothetical protein